MQFSNFCTDSDCNSIFKHADSIQVTIMEMKKKA